MDIGKRIKERRKALGLSADQVAEQIGKDRATVYRYEAKAIEKLPVDILSRLAEILQTTPQYLMGVPNEKALGVGDRIRARRLALGLSLEEIAKYIGQDRTTVSQYETHAIESMPLTILTPMAEILRTTPQYLLGIASDEVPKGLSQVAQDLEATIAGLDVYASELAEESETLRDLLTVALNIVRRRM